MRRLVEQRKDEAQIDLWKRRLASMLLAVPLTSLALATISWLRYGIDLPFQDDWREYLLGTAGTFAFETLFRPSNDTLYPVGKFLDAVAQHLLDGNSVAYQLISMIAVLGLLLFLQWRLLRLVIENKLSLALAFLLTIFMLQPDSYWGRQNIAYHQAIPLVCVLGALYLALGPTPWSRWSTTLAVAISLISGFSYVSGAIAMLMTGLTLIIVKLPIDDLDSRRARSIGLALLAGVLVSLPAQLWVIFGVNAGRTHRPDAPWTFPYEADFWLFILGMVARSLLLPKKYPLFSLLIAASVCAVMLVVSLRSIRQLQGRAAGNPRLAIIFTALLSSITAYLCMVSVGRAGLRSEDVDTASEVFISGYRRFYFAWVTLIWPWLAAVALAADDPKARPSRRTFLAVLVICAFAAIVGVFNHHGYYAKLAGGRVETQVRCLQHQLRAGAGIVCPRLHPGDLASAYAYGSSIGASFSRSFPMPTVHIGEAAAQPLFRLSSAEQQAWKSEDMAVSHAGPVGLLLRPASNDAALIVRLQTGIILRSCFHLQASLVVKAARPHVVQVSFRRPGESIWRKASGQVRSLSENKTNFEEIYFHADSSEGFEPVLRIQPGAERELHVKEVEIRCLLRKR